MTTKTVAVEDKRNKECTVCSKTYYDTTRPNNKKTCSTGCATVRKNKGQREVYREINPPKPNQRQRSYYAHYEYSFWNSMDKNPEEIMRNQTWKHEVPYEMEDIEHISAAISRDELRQYL